MQRKGVEDMTKESGARAEHNANVLAKAYDYRSAWTHLRAGIDHGLALESIRSRVHHSMDKERELLEVARADWTEKKGDDDADSE